MKERVFRFKQFNISHEQSAMKVGVDGVMIGAWASVGHGPCHILDAGCGCGVISLMAAQRNPEAIITAIDIHAPSVEEATRNAGSSSWGERIGVKQADFMDVAGRFHHIISNPPFFHSGIDTPATARESARHATTLFGPEALMARADELLASYGTMAFIAPFSEFRNLQKALHGSLALLRVAYVYGRTGKEPKRVMMEIGKDVATTCEPRIEDIYIECADASGRWDYSQEYRALCADFYLKF